MNEIEQPEGRVSSILAIHRTLYVPGFSGGVAQVAELRVDGSSVVITEGNDLVWTDFFGDDEAEKLKMDHIEGLMNRASSSPLTVLDGSSQAYVFAAGDWPMLKLQLLTE